MTDIALSTFHFCPHCGSTCFATVEGEPRARHCSSCGFTYYINPAAAVAALLFDAEGRLLLTRRAHEPAKGTWDLPGGFAEFDESLEIALCRELHEELGLQLPPDALTYFTSRPNRYPFGGLTVHTLDAVFRAQLPHDVQLAPHDDVDDFRFFPLSQINLDSIGLESIRSILKQVLALK
jgi:NAD+ diphosphatase